MSACSAAMFAGVPIFAIIAFAPSTRDPWAVFSASHTPDISTRIAGPTRDSRAPTTGNQGLVQAGWQLCKGAWADAPDNGPSTPPSPTPWGSQTPHAQSQCNWTIFKEALGIYSTKGSSAQHLDQVEARPTYSPVLSTPPRSTPWGSLTPHAQPTHNGTTFKNAHGLW